MEPDPNPDAPLRPDERFTVDVNRFVEGRPDPSESVHPPGNGELDVMAMLEAQAQLDRIVG